MGQVLSSSDMQAALCLVAMYEKILSNCVCVCVCVGGSSLVLEWGFSLVECSSRIVMG